MFGEVVYLALGSNLGDRIGAMRAAVAAVSRLPGSGELTVASLYQTSPVGEACAGQDDYLNSALRLTTTLSAREVLSAILAIEADLGRIRTRPWEPRPIDLDILLYGSTTIHEPGLVVPHPRMRERLFVLEPLGELAGDVVHPILGGTVAELLHERRRLAMGQAVRKVAGTSWWRIDSDQAV